MSKKTSKKPKIFVHKTAIIEDDVKIGEGTKIWHFSQIRKGSVLGKNCIIGKSVFIDFDSVIGDNVKIQNHAILYHKAILENGVFIGPNVTFTNDKTPRAVNPDGSLKKADDWEVSVIKIGEGASIGGHSVILPGVNIGKYVLAGAGSVITRDVPDYALVYGNPARIKDFVCRCGKRLIKIEAKGNIALAKCSCGIEIKIPKEIYQQKEANKITRRIWIR